MCVCVCERERESGKGSVCLIWLCVQVLRPLLCSRLWLQEVAVWKDCHSILVELTRWAGQHSPGGVADKAWQQLMGTLREYLTSSKSDPRTPAADVERMDVEVCLWVGGGAGPCM